MRTKKLSVGSCAVRGIDEVKAKNVLPFAASTVIHARKPGTFYLQNTAKNFIYQVCAAPNTMRNRNQSDFKSEEENCIFINGF